jgi:hypothetical protein
MLQMYIYEIDIQCVYIRPIMHDRMCTVICIISRFL